MAKSWARRRREEAVVNIVLDLLHTHGDMSSRALIGTSKHLRRFYTPVKLSALLKREPHVDSYVKQGILVWTPTARGIGAEMVPSDLA
jgi:hypothetical protein